MLYTPNKILCYSGTARSHLNRVFFLNRSHCLLSLMAMNPGLSNACHKCSDWSSQHARRAWRLNSYCCRAHTVWSCLLLLRQYCAILARSNAQYRLSASFARSARPPHEPGSALLWWSIDRPCRYTVAQWKWNVFSSFLHIDQSSYVAVLSTNHHNYIHL
jgi:hypothetical protein